MISTKITKMLGIKHPIVTAPMGPFKTTDLAIAVSEAGGLGVLSHTSYAPNGVVTNERGLGDTVKAMKQNMLHVVEHTDKPFGFNIRTGRRGLDVKALCTIIPKFVMENTRIKDQCRYAVTSAGSSKILPASKDFQDLKSSGSQIKHFHVAPASWLADKCAKVGVDGVVLTGTEGGGHQSYEKVSTLVLLQQVQENHPDLPKIACGGFATGRSLAAALSLGAGAIAMGSRFIATKESEFHETYKNVVPTGKAQETDLYTGGYGPIRLWANEYTKTRGLVKSKEEKMAQEEAMLKLSREEILKEQTKGAKAYIAAYQGDINSGAVLLGQSIGIIKSIESVPDLMEKIMKDAESSIRSISNSIS